MQAEHQMRCPPLSTHVISLLVGLTVSLAGETALAETEIGGPSFLRWDFDLAFSSTWNTVKKHDDAVEREDFWRGMGMGGALYLGWTWKNGWSTSAGVMHTRLSEVKVRGHDSGGREETWTLVGPAFHCYPEPKIGLNYGIMPGLVVSDGVGVGLAASTGYDWRVARHIHAGIAWQLTFAAVATHLLDDNHDGHKKAFHSVFVFYTTIR